MSKTLRCLGRDPSLAAGGKSNSVAMVDISILETRWELLETKIDVSSEFWLASGEEREGSEKKWRMSETFRCLGCNPSLAAGGKFNSVVMVSRYLNFGGTWGRARRKIHEAPRKPRGSPTSHKRVTAVTYMYVRTYRQFFCILGSC